ncbi:MAG: low molecular weight phosphotyrosine protein phosphatase [Leptospiraceae bacterium]|nr:low molecular weight phosphotyrosine protein phosphatase [Leptospiraceae bacterium]MDW8306087.1 low molecular weight protein-tyrosine-phosphatase [Leptospiraceae bacterium]
MKKILFVCLGNICRSPLAQGIFEKKIADRGLSGKYYADSAGISAYHEGERPHIGSIRVAREKGIDIEKQRSRPVRYSDRHEFDYFVAMDRSNYHALLTDFALPPEKVLLMRDFDPQGGDDVPDPWGKNHAAFLEVYAILDRSIEKFIDFLEKDRT